MKFKISLIFVASCLFSYSCGHSSKSQPEEAVSDNATSSEVQSEVLGVWQSKNDGKVFKIYESDEGGKVDIYDITFAPPSLCSRFESRNYTEYVKDRTLSASENTLVMKHKTAIHSTKLTKLKGLPPSCKNTKTKDVYKNFDFFMSTFREHYAFLDHRLNKSFDEVEKNARNDLTRGKVLDAVLGDFVLSLHDNHTSLEADDHNYEGESNRRDVYDLMSNLSEILKTTRQKLDWEEKLEEHFQTFFAMVEKNYVADLHKEANGLLVWGVLKGVNEPIGFLQIRAMQGFAKGIGGFHLGVEKINEAMDYFEGEKVRGLIIDIRLNGGGWDRIGLELAKRMTSSKRTAYFKKFKLPESKQYTGPLEIFLKPKKESPLSNVASYIMMSAFTRSAAETFALAASQMPQVTLVGSPSNGMFSDMLTKKMPNGWKFSLSNEVYYVVKDGKEQTFEVVGLQPKFMFPNDFLESSNIEKGIDTGLEMLKYKVLKNVKADLK